MPAIAFDSRRIIPCFVIVEVLGFTDGMAVCNQITSPDSACSGLFSPLKNDLCFVKA